MKKTISFSFNSNVIFAITCFVIFTPADKVVKEDSEY